MPDQRVASERVNPDRSPWNGKRGVLAGLENGAISI
jgi:hypothetical protein